MDLTESRAGLDVSYVEEGQSGRRMLEIYEACETPCWYNVRRQVICPFPLAAWLRTE